jgi:hypothetical protein
MVVVPIRTVPSHGDDGVTAMATMTIQMLECQAQQMLS